MTTTQQQQQNEEEEEDYENVDEEHYPTLIPTKTLAATIAQMIAPQNVALFLMTRVAKNTPYRGLRQPQS